MYGKVDYAGAEKNNMMKYRAAGVKVYWIVDPLRRMVRVYNFANEDETADYSFEESVHVFIYPDLSLRFSEYE